MKETIKLTHEKAETIALTLKVLGHSTRIKIVFILQECHKLSVNQILERLNDSKIDQPTLSHHLIKLKNAGILKSTKSGLFVYYELSSPQYANIIHTLS